MATLADINQTLVRVDDNTENTSRGITSFLKQMAEDKRKQLEASREQKQAVADVGRMQGESSAQSSGGGGGGLLGGVKNMLAGASMATLASTIGRGLMKRVLGPAAIAVFAEDIVEFLLPEGFENQAIKDALSGGLQGGAIGFMVGGPLGAAIGAGIGALMKNEKFKKAVEDLGGELKQMGKDLYEKLEPTVINFKNNFLDFFDALGITKEGVVKGLALALTTIGDAAASGIESITKMIKGDFEVMDVVKGITTIGTVAALLMPGKFLKLLGLLAGKKGLLKGLMAIAAGGGAALTGLITMLGGGANKNVVFDEKSQRYRNTQTGKFVQGPGSTVKNVKPTTSGGSGGTAASQMSNAVKRFPLLSKLIKLGSKIPGLATAGALIQLATMKPVTVDGGAGILGGLGGGTLGALAGAFVGGLTGPAAVAAVPLGTFVGGLGGYIFGEAISKGLAELALGKKVTAFPDFINDMLNGKSTTTSNQPQVGTDAMRMRGGGGTPQTFTKPSAQAGNNLKSSISQPSGMSPGAMSGTGGGTAVVNSGNTTNTVNNSQGLVLGNKTTTADKDDPFSLSNQIKSVGGSAAFGF